MLITVKPLENEKETKVKANVSLETKDFTLTEFKLYQDEKDENKLKLLIPSSLVTDKEGNPKMKDGKFVNTHPVSINNNLGNRNEIFQKLQNEVVKLFSSGNFEEGRAQAEVSIPEAENGALNVTNIWSINPTLVSNSEYQHKANCTILTGAFQINNVALIYNTKTNDYNIIMPNYKIKSEDPQKNVTRSFSVPKSSAVFAKVKGLIVSGYESKQRAALKEYKDKKLQESQAQAQKNSAMQQNAPKETQAPVMK